MATKERSKLRNLIEFVPAWLVLHSLTLMPRELAVLTGELIARLCYYLHHRLRNVAHRNLDLAMPELDKAARGAIVKTVFLNMGRLLAEFSQFPKLNRQNI